MTTRRAKAHQLLVRSERNLKKAFRTHNLFVRGLYLFSSEVGYSRYVNEWKKKKQPRGTAGGCMNGN